MVRTLEPKCNKEQTRESQYQIRMIKVRHNDYLNRGAKTIGMKTSPNDYKES